MAAVGGGAFFSWESLRIGWTSMLYSLLDRFDMVRRGAKQPMMPGRKHNDEELAEDCITSFRLCVLRNWDGSCGCLPPDA